MWYVFYWDSGQYSNEWEAFETEETAMAFINECMKSGSNLEDIKLIEGTEIKLKAIEVTTKVVRA